eukprot:TRINITY_DN309_c1_g2_i2.p1 TRINITY_DN309_c1_g2~~TRINITY_DN309_c1_g2_i2.p1  ORF type:complete len:315 (+),score=101.23 TRINITY_DN309_c1_g2_i2:83-946(+)
MPPYMPPPGAMLHGPPGLPPPGHLPPSGHLPPPGFPPAFPNPNAPRPAVLAQGPKSYAADYAMHQKLISAGLAGQVTNVWVGKISPIIEDSLVRKFLEFCGPLTAWDRVEVGGQPKSFGFAKFSHGEGAQRALRLLNGLKLGNEELLLRVDTNTTEQLAEYEKKKEAFIAKEKEERSKLSEEQLAQLAPLPFSDTEDRDREAKRNIDLILTGINTALEEGEEHEGLVGKEVRVYKEKLANVERGKREKEMELERRKKEKEEQENRERQRRKEREEREFRERERRTRK